MSLLKSSLQKIRNFKQQFASQITPQTGLLFWVALFIMLTGNHAMISRVLEVYPFTWANAPFLISLFLFFTLTTTLFFCVVCQGRASRWLLAFFLVGASLAAYYMDQFGVIIDTVMFDNIDQTNKQELMGLLSNDLLIKLFLFGMLPAFVVIKYGKPSQGFAPEFKSRAKFFGMLLLVLIVIVLPFLPSYIHFTREHRVIRFYANPTYFSYSLVKYAAAKLNPETVGPLQLTATDAKKIGDASRHQLAIMVVGETARADRFSLNGYARVTNPELAKQNVVSLSRVTSCGTSTTISVPCMFSVLTRKEFSKAKAKQMENALDVLHKHGVEVLWRDNNSDSKDVATRLRYEDFKTPTLNPDCKGECRDIGMLSGLDQFIAARKNKDILIVLHQMGNHGPEYYRRYPKEFQRFNPICTTGEVRKCSQQELDNSYDNAILYTDYFLAQVIEFLKKYDNSYETAMLYVSDHGESLGENGIYLHAAPYATAPKAQTHVPAVLWFGQQFGYSIDQLKAYQDHPFSHDDLFCALLVGFNIQTKTCAALEPALMLNRHLKQAN